MISLWEDTQKIDYKCKIIDFEHAEVVIIGAGIAGILTAYELKQKGINAKILEADKVLAGVTRNTTAKITSQHNLIYDKLINTAGIEKAGQYYKANEQAIKRFQEIVNQMNIACDFERSPAYVYSTKKIGELEKEIKACEKLGILADFVTKTSLPFPVKGAVRFNNQAHFHPLKFLNSIIYLLDIYENAKVKAIEGNKIIIANNIKIDNTEIDRSKEDKSYTNISENIYTVTADHIIITSHYPFINTPGYYFMRMHQERSYVIAFKNDIKLDGMYISSDDDGYSLRKYENYLLLGGAGHRTGKNEMGGRYDILMKAAKEYFGEVKECYRWSAQDCMSIDRIPYIGRFSESTPNMYIATGFNKWGMSSSMVAAGIISDMITCSIKVENTPILEANNAEVFSPSRFHMAASMSNIAADGIETVKGILLKKLSIPREQLRHIEMGKSGIVQYEGQKIGAYRNEEGELFLVSIICTHLGCQLEWNQDELSWDCPCHGSRFDYKGNLINNPALENLEYV